jgi:Kef-type K+ transport system membrane component KefB
MLTEFLESLTHLPTMTRFAIALSMFLFMPKWCRRFGLPSAVGLLAAGVVFGPSVLAIAPQNPQVAEFFSDIGKLLLMFFAGLEINITQFNQTRNRSMVFGLLSFALPLMAGIGVGLLFGYGGLAALLIGSLMASHTLLGFPIVQRLGLTENEAVTVTVGATIFTDLGALLILAICLPVHSVGFSAPAFVLQLTELAIYVPVVLFGLSALGRRFLHRYGDTTENQFFIILLIMILAAEGAELIHLEAIIGAFLAGLAVNRSLQRSEAKEQLEFLANTLFIPMFFLTIGFLIDVRVFARTLVANFGLCVGIVGGLIGAKFAAAFAAQRLFAYSTTEGWLMGALSLPQVAATLAAALVAYQTTNAAGVRLIDEPVINTVIVLMVVTSALGSILTERFGERLVPNAASAEQLTAVASGAYGHSGRSSANG